MFNRNRIINFIIIGDESMITFDLWWWICIVGCSGITIWFVVGGIKDYIGNKIKIKG